MSTCDSPSHDRVRLSSAEVRALAVMEDAEDDPLDELWGIPCRAGRLVSRLRGLARRARHAVVAAGWTQVAALGAAVLLGAVLPVAVVVGGAVLVALVGLGALAGERAVTIGRAGAVVRAASVRAASVPRPWSRSSRRGEGRG